MRNSPRLCAISIDLDEIPNYFAIHGLKPPEGEQAHAVYRIALSRFADFADSNDIPLTFFVVGQDLSDEVSAKILRNLMSRGHEVANHSLDHRYDLTRLTKAQMHHQVDGGMKAIESATGVRPKGFRAPGYLINDTLVDVLREQHVLYDSSVFPCPAYVGAKALAMASMAVRSRKSRSILSHPRVLLAPTRPYRLGRPYTRRGQGPIELPIQVTRGMRLPYIGTTLTLAGIHRARWLTRMVLGESLINLELHGIDLLDHTDGLQGLIAHQPDIKVPWEEKLAILTDTVVRLRKAGYGFVRLDDAAEQFSNR